MPGIFAIGDLHLANSVANKAMDVFGDGWKEHTRRLKEGWQDAVGEKDIVLIPGDISWAMSLSEAEADLAFLQELKGLKVLLKGNHDFWWSGYTKVLSALPPSIRAVQNNTVRLGSLCVGGTRGWLSPNSAAFSETADRKIYEREKIRLGLSLQGFREDTYNVVMLHYPPFSEKGQPTEFAYMLAGKPIQQAVYGHLHGKAGEGAFEGDFEGVTYRFTAADHLQFVPLKIADL